tara:strand:+ start:254 stop:820 length:567 start_codon:yes stop_codon:yes gene_type:complete
MKHLCWYYNKIIDEKSVNNIVKACLKSPLVDGKIGLNKTINKKTRSAKIHFIDKNKHALLYKTIYDLAEDANNSAYGFDINSVELCQFTLYEESNSGHYDWHIDTNWLDETSMRHRKISVVIQLSDPSEYKGGELEIQDSNLNSQQLKETMQKGSVITFPSFVQHRVKPITKGKRMSLIGWVVGAKFR